MWAQDFLAAHPADKPITSARSKESSETTGSRRQVINDSWTPSGPMHIGSFRSMVIHDVLRRVLQSQQKDVTYLYGYDDYDPMDGIPPGFSGYEEHLGKPLISVPAPDSHFANFAEQFIAENKSHHQTLGIKAEHYRTSELYKSGQFDPAIAKVLDQAGLIRKIYLEVSGSERPDDWYPVQVICPNCGKLGSTYVSAWDGREVTFECRKDLVPWAKGCGYLGKTSPLGGLAKMHWRVEWAAKWDLFGVSIEAAGKDHANKGGSFDTGQRILKEVFGKKAVAAFPHEFFLLHGKKMGSTKGVITPEDALSVFTPELLRFLIVRTRPNQAIEIDLTQIVPPTYDEYDRCQISYQDKSNPDQADYFSFAQIDPAKPDLAPKTRFSNVVSLLQLPGMTSELERPETAPRVPCASVWLDKYAPPEMKFMVEEKLPTQVASLTAAQKKFLAEAVGLIGEKDGEKLQADLYLLSQKLNLPAKSAFNAIYKSLIGKDSGPRAGLLIASQDPVFIKRRFAESAQ